MNNEQRQKILFHLRDMAVANGIKLDGEISGSTSLQDDLEIDSMDAVSLAIELENEFDIEIDDEDFADLDTVDQFLKMVDSKL